MARKLLLVPILILGFCVVARAQNDAKAHSSLNGIWHVIGDKWSTSWPWPIVDATLSVEGDTIYAEAGFNVLCSNGNTSQAFRLLLKGKIAEDGTFLLGSDHDSVSPQAEIRGHIPDAGATSWAGSLTIENPSSDSKCIYSVAKDLVAQAYPSLSGTYSGTITGPGMGAGLAITLHLTPGEVTADATHSQKEPRYFTPLNATIDVSGYRIHKATTDAVLSHTRGRNRVRGDGFSLEFPTDDGVTINLAGDYRDLSGSTLQVIYFTSLPSDNAPESAAGNLTRQ
jgi:hypothetical protein